MGCMSVTWVVPCKCSQVRSCQLHLLLPGAAGGRAGAWGTISRGDAARPRSI